jgi:hypothetical protein
MSVRTILAIAAAAALLTAGCANPRSGSLGPAPTLPPVEQQSATVTGAPPAGTPSGTPVGPSTSVRLPPTDAAPQRPGTITVQLWFIRAGQLSPTRRTRPATLATTRLALTELTAGPTVAEKRAGLATGLPAEPAFTINGISGRVATIDFAAAFYGGATDTVRLRQAQVVYTLTQFPTVTTVRFLADGDPAGAAVGRDAYTDLLPPIVVLNPVIGQRVTSPITVTGTADVFEATVNVRVLDPAGRPLATAFTTAACSGGCRGQYRVTISYRSADAGPGTVEVYWVSPEDGARRHVVAVPVRLAATA